MEILKELYFGHISEISRKIKQPDIKQKKKEEELYDEILSYLPKDQQSLLDDFIDCIYLNIDNEIIDKYIQGFKTGALIGIEIGNLDLD